MSSQPHLVFADRIGQVYDHPSLLAVGNSGRETVLADAIEWIPLPYGSQLYVLPETIPFGYHLKMKRILPLKQWRVGRRRERVSALAAYTPPSYTRTLLPAAEYAEKRDWLPLWSYTAVGWKDGHFWTSVFKSDPRDGWNPIHYEKDLTNIVQQKVEANPENRLWQQLARCTLEYGCNAAYNAMIGRLEFPIPTSPACNSNCVGCLSFQPKNSCSASQERVKYRLSPEEIADAVVPHLNTTENGVASFGQGCEGEPLLQANVLEASIRLIRRQTELGTINLNTNGSRPQLIRKLSDAGLQTIRISLNSGIEESYNRYFRPQGYTFADVRKSLKICKKHHIFTSINLLIFPGVTDQPDEVEGLIRLVDETGLDYIQLRNLSIDPLMYLNLYPEYQHRGIGIRKMVETLQQEFPHLQFGYFNRPKELLNSESTLLSD